MFATVLMLGVIGWALLGFVLCNTVDKTAYEYLARDCESSKRHFIEAHEENKRLRAKLESLEEQANQQPMGV